MHSGIALDSLLQNHFSIHSLPSAPFSPREMLQHTTPPCLTHGAPKHCQSASRELTLSMLDATATQGSF